MVTYENSVPAVRDRTLVKSVGPDRLALPLIAINFVVTVTGARSILFQELCGCNMTRLGPSLTGADIRSTSSPAKSS